MLMSELGIDLLRSGLPTAGAVGGYVYGSKRPKAQRWWQLGLWTLGGWSLAWLASRMILSVLEERDSHLSATLPVFRMPQGAPAQPQPQQSYAGPVEPQPVQAPPISAPSMSGVQPQRRHPPPPPAPAAPSYDASRKVSNGDTVRVSGTFFGGSAYGGY